MQANFKAALEHVRISEGGWTDNPKDPGGATMKGVTLNTFRRHFGQDKTKDDLSNITNAQLEQIYRTGYWDKCHCGELPDGLDYAVFDAAVNSGPGRSAKWLQAAVGAKQDGGIGPKTLAKLKKYKPMDVINKICDLRLAFLQSLSTWSTFGKGWGRRVKSVRKTALVMAGGNPSNPSKPAPPASFKTLKKGSKGPWVRKLQAALGIHVDGKFGPDTKAALIAWQQDNGLEPDGIAGRNTYRALGLIA